MKKILPVFFIIAFMLSINDSYAQTWRRKRNHSLMNSKSRLRHTQGIKSIGASFGITEGGYYYQAEGIYYYVQNAGVAVLGSYNSYQINTISGQRFELTPYYTYTAFNVSGFFFLNVNGGLTGRYEIFEGTEELRVKNQFNVGLMGQVEGEIYFTEVLSLYLFARQDYFFIKPGNFRNVVGTGLRVSFK